MSLPRIVARLVKPVAVGSLILLILAVVLTLTGSAPANLERFWVLYASAAAVAGVCLLVLALGPSALVRRLRLGLLIAAGLAFAVLQGNGLADGGSRLLLIIANVATLGLAVPTLIVVLESDQNRTASRF